MKGLFKRKENGQGLVEYGLIAVLVAIVAIGSVTFVGGSVVDSFNGSVAMFDGGTTPETPESELRTLSEIFPDDAFAEVVREQMNTLWFRTLDPINTIDERVIRAKDCQNVETINVTTDRGIVSLAGINELTKLHTININNNPSLKTVPEFATMPQLKQLYLDNNGLTELPSLAALPNLRALHVGNNDLNSLPNLDHLGGVLESISAINNNLSGAFDVSQLPLLEELFLSSNNLTSVPGVETLIHLEQFHAGNNPLVSLPDLSALTAMRKLYLDNTGISTLSGVEWMTNLTVLSASGNSLTVCPDVSGLSKLDTLRINDNQISTLPNLLNLPLLTRLYVNTNQLSVFPDVSGSSNLTLLRVNGNASIDSIPTYVGTLSKLTLLGVEDTGITSLPIALKNKSDLVVTPSGLPYV